MPVSITTTAPIVLSHSNQSPVTVACSVPTETQSVLQFSKAAAVATILDEDDQYQDER